MILDSTQITMTAEGVTFTTATAHGAQVVKVSLLTREPKILPSVMFFENGELVFRPLWLSLVEFQEFLDLAKKKWTLSHPKG